MKESPASVVDHSPVKSCFFDLFVGVSVFCRLVPVTCRSLQYAFRHTLLLREPTFLGGKIHTPYQGCIYLDFCFRALSASCMQADGCCLEADLERIVNYVQAATANVDQSLAIGI